MRNTRLMIVVCGLLGTLSVLATTWPGMAGAAELTPDLQKLLQELQQSPGAPPAPSSPGVPQPASPPVGDYDDALLRYGNVADMASESAGNRAAELARMLQALEAQLGAVAKTLPPQPAEPPSALPPPEHASAGAVEESRPATPPAQVPPPGPLSAADAYDDLAQRLEAQAAALRAMARQVRGVSK